MIGDSTSPPLVSLLGHLAGSRSGAWRVPLKANFMFDTAIMNGVLLRGSYERHVRTHRWCQY